MLTANMAVELEGLSAGYHGKPVLQDVTLRIAEGELAGLIGPNGAGKTTLIRCLTGLCVPLGGHVRLFGRDIADIPAAERARFVAVVPQEVETPMSLTVEEVVMIGRTASLSRWRPPTADHQAIVDRAMVYTDVAEMRNRPLDELSGGEKQRVIVAMALAQEPRLILMDEATSHLDINHRLEIMQIVERLNTEQNVTVLMVSHDLNLAAEFCRRLMMMSHGRVVSDGAPSEVLTEPLLQRVYDCDIRVQQNASGSVSVLPAPRLVTGKSGQGVHVHVVGGGGSVGEVLRRLSLGDYTVTCGVLNEGDSDVDVTAALSIEAALEKPFLPISPEALDAARAMIRKASVVIVGNVPIGTGNVANLELAEEALSEGKHVLVMEGLAQRDHTPDKLAAAKADTLQKNGAVFWSSIAELFALLKDLGPDS